MSGGNDDDQRSPWLKGVSGITGVVPPGRRLSPKSEPRPTKWSASGVKGVTPPGKLGPTEGPSVDWAMRDERKKKKVAKANERAAEAGRRSGKTTMDPLRPTAGATGNVFADAKFPASVDLLLKEMNQFAEEDRPDEHTARELAQLITQSHAPFEIVVAFALLSGTTAGEDHLREFFAPALERGAMVFFNLLRRLDKTVKVPPGIIVERVDPMFFDLPTSAMQVPFAFATHSFQVVSEMLERSEPEYDEKLFEFRASLYERFISGRTVGDESLERMFPFRG